MARNLVRIAALLIGIVTLASLIAPAAHAGGPTSVLLVDHQSERAGALTAAQPDYARLEQLMATRMPLGVAEPSWETDRQLVRITWLLHDVDVWRTNIIAETADGTLWNCAAMSFEGPMPECSWGVVESPVGLRELLGRLGFGALSTTPNRLTGFVGRFC